MFVYIFPAYFSNNAIEVTNNNIPALIGQSPSGIAVNPRTNLIYVALPGSNSVSVINGTDNKIIQNITGVGQSPSGIAVNQFTNLIYVALPGSNSVSVINGTDNKIIKNISGSSLPNGVSINSQSNRISLVNESKSVYVIDGTLNRLITNISLPESPTSIAVSTIFNIIYVSSLNSVFFINGLDNSIIQPGIESENAVTFNISPKTATSTTSQSEAVCGTQLPGVDLFGSWTWNSTIGGVTQSGIITFKDDCTYTSIGKSGFITNDVGHFVIGSYPATIKLQTKFGNEDNYLITHIAENSFHLSDLDNEVSFDFIRS